MPKRYPSEFRRRVLDLLYLLDADRSVAQVARDLEIPNQTIYVWRRQEAIDKGLLTGPTSTEIAELAAARRRIAQDRCGKRHSQWTHERRAPPHESRPHKGDLHSRNGA